MLVVNTCFGENLVESEISLKRAFGFDFHFNSECYRFAINLSLTELTFVCYNQIHYNLFRCPKRLKLEKCDFFKYQGELKKGGWFFDRYYTLPSDSSFKLTSGKETIIYTRNKLIYIYHCGSKVKIIDTVAESPESSAKDCGQIIKALTKIF